VCNSSKLGWALGRNCCLDVKERMYMTQIKVGPLGNCCLDVKERKYLTQIKVGPRGELLFRRQSTCVIHLNQGGPPGGTVV
jgi:hypothetical protein